MQLFFILFFFLINLIIFFDDNGISDSAVYVNQPLWTEFSQQSSPCDNSSKQAPDHSRFICGVEVLHVPILSWSSLYFTYTLLNWYMDEWFVTHRYITPQIRKSTILYKTLLVFTLKVPGELENTLQEFSNKGLMTMYILWRLIKIIKSCPK